ncbi:class I adenylate-forming enzyme family protein [Pseudobutyrivibrio sp.]|uniref:class I adenylate-forming enzyme family protein n=1 Tax=Pseudobutyrivibrio sp. TaxID=2014367 RepID=UPI001B4698D8|nr:AMP-binding protein [Pseudobutyrivibrio sp.]MBP3260896.1 AMP-binding protein [Pseudobutyrivibrio sp.]
MYDLYSEIKAYGDRIAYRYFRNDVLEEVTYKQFYNDICECLENLQNTYGDITDKHVAILSNNCYEVLVLIAALILGNAVVIPINIRESKEHIDEIIDDANADIVIRQAEGDNYFPNLCEFKRNKEYSHTFDLSDENRLGVIIYTSGTTGKSKGVVLSYKSLFGGRHNILPKEYIEDPNKNDVLRTYLVFPMYHAAGFVSWLCWCNRGCMTYINENVGDMLNELEKIEIDFSFISPSTLSLWRKRFKRGGIAKIGNLKGVCTAGAPITKELIEFFLENGINYCQVYGMTETLEATYNGNMTDKVTSVGRSVEGADVKIVDDEICIANWSNMKGYYNNPEASTEINIDGYIHTGDIGYIDEDGYVFITGRKKNLIILSGGENVSPEELENLLYKNQSVKECKVFEREDKIVAAVYASDDKQETIRQYVQDLNKGLPIFKRIHIVEFQNTEFDKTASGKIRR